MRAELLHVRVAALARRAVLPVAVEYLQEHRDALRVVRGRVARRRDVVYVEAVRPTLGQRAVPVMEAVEAHREGLQLHRR